MVNIVGPRPIYINLGHHRPIQVTGIMRAGCKIARRADSYNLFSFLSNQVTEDEVEVGTRAKLLIRQVSEISTRYCLLKLMNTSNFKGEVREAIF